MAESADYTVTFRVTSPSWTEGFGDDEAARQEWREAGIERQSEMLDATFGDFVRSLSGSFEVLSTTLAESQPAAA